LTGELLNLFTPAIADLRLIPSSGGRFEVLADELVIFSKKGIGRHAEPGEVARLVGEKLGIKPMPSAGDPE
jgi:selenoprotein W-related protein